MCHFPKCRRSGLQQCTTCDGTYCSQHILPLSSGKTSCFVCVEQVMRDREEQTGSASAAIEAYLKHSMESFEWNVRAQSSEDALTNASILVKHLEQAGLKIKRDRRAQQEEGKGCCLFLAGTVIVSIGMSAVSLLSIWEKVGGIGSMLFGLFLLGAGAASFVKRGELDDALDQSSTALDVLAKGVITLGGGWVILGGMLSFLATIIGVTVMIFTMVFHPVLRVVLGLALFYQGIQMGGIWAVFSWIGAILAVWILAGMAIAKKLRMD